MQSLKSLPQWIVWRSEKRAGQTTKIPYQLNGKPASSTDPLTWTDYGSAKENATNFSGIGFVLTTESRILFIDLDKCLDDLPPEFQDLIAKCNTYTEVSPSGNGLHLLLEIEGDLYLTANRSKKMPHFECYNTGRYMTVTENIYEGHDTIRKVSVEDANELLRIVGYPWKEEPSGGRSLALPPVTLDTNNLLERMFASKNGKKIKALYDGDLSEYGDDDSAADMAFCMHLAFWFGKDIDRMRSVWLSSPLGSRKKTQSRADYQIRTLQHAIDATKEVYKSPAQVVKDKLGVEIDFQTDAKGNPIANMTNVLRILRADPVTKRAFRYNEFFRLEEALQDGKWVPFEKRHILEVMEYIQKSYPFFERISLVTIEQAVTLYLYDWVINEPREYLHGLQWDGEHRLNHWLSIVYGTPDDEYHSAVGANWLKGLARRVCEPGCKFDYVLVLEGPQGYRKTTSMHILGRGMHVETTMSTDNKDFYLLLLRNIIVEFSEGETLSRSEIKNLKAVLTMQEDQFRLPYGRNVAMYPRHCVFAMTTNQSQYLKDETGNRRWLPVTLTMVADTEWLEKNLDQLYAEAYHRVITLGETTYDFPAEATLKAQQERMVEDPYEEAITMWYKGLTFEDRDEGITAIEVFQKVYQQGVPLGRELPKAQSMVIASVLKNTLHLSRERRTFDGVRVWRWFPTEETKKMFPVESEWVIREKAF